MKRSYCIAAVTAGLTLAMSAHEAKYSHLHGSTNAAAPLKVAVETAGPAKPLPAHGPVSGQGFWKFAAAKELMPTPEETKPFLKGAHGTIVVDAERDLVYWGLERVGWVAFSDKLTKSWVVKGDPMFAKGNLHGADLLPRAGQLPLVVSADNNEGEVYLSDTSFLNARKLDWPQDGPYTNKAQYKPTDATFAGGAADFWVTDGYGKQWFMHATTDPLKFDGPFIGGSASSRTPHGITYLAENKTLLISARPEAQIKEYDFKKDEWRETIGLPPGDIVCDVDVWGDYLLAACLDGAKGAPGPILIVNWKKKTLVSTIRVKEDLGYADAQHIHDATWYVRGEGDKREVYILFTNWNPGGVGAVKLVSAPDAP